MAYTTFESDLLDAQTNFAYIPTGAILMLAAPYTTLSSVDLRSLGLLRCDGETWQVSSYPDLFDIIGYTYGGSENIFQVPDLHTTKQSIKGSSNTAVVGTVTSTANHNHSVTSTPTWNLSQTPVSANGAEVAMTHNHNNYSSTLSFNANTAGDQGSVHNHTGDTAVGGVPNLESSSAANGNTNNTGTPQHTHNMSFNASTTSNATYSEGHSGAHVVDVTGLANTVQYNTGTTAFTNTHTHNSASMTGLTSTNNSLTGYPVPYANMLYFIKA
jgi:microcystin-dependent protein